MKWVILGILQTMLMLQLPLGAEAYLKSSKNSMAYNNAYEALSNMRYTVLDFNMRQLPQEPIIFQALTEQILLARPDIVSLRVIASAPLADAFYERLEEDYEYFYMTSDSFIASKYPVESPELMFAQIAELSATNNVFVTISMIDE